MFWWILAAAVASVSCGGPREPGFNCSGIEGLAWWACKSFGECRGGNHVQNDCPDGMAFDQQFSCVDVNSAPFPCNLDRTPECENIGTMVTSIAEQESGGQDPPCSFFYTCNNGHFAGHQKCPSGLVFFEDEQVCRDPADVPAPCGFGSANGNNGGNFGRNLNSNNYGNGGNYGGNGGYGRSNGGTGGTGGTGGGYPGNNGGTGGGYPGNNGGTGGGYGGNNGGTGGGYGGNTGGYGGNTGGNTGGYGGNNGGYGRTNGNTGNGGYGGNTGGWGGGYTESYPKKNNYNYNY